MRKQKKILSTLIMLIIPMAPICAMDQGKLETIKIDQKDYDCKNLFNALKEKVQSAYNLNPHFNDYAYRSRLLMDDSTQKNRDEFLKLVADTFCLNQKDLNDATSEKLARVIENGINQVQPENYIPDYRKYQQKAAVAFFLRTVIPLSCVIVGYGTNWINPKVLGMVGILSHLGGAYTFSSAQENRKKSDFLEKQQQTWDQTDKRILQLIATALRTQVSIKQDTPKNYDFPKQDSKDAPEMQESIANLKKNKENLLGFIAKWRLGKDDQQLVDVIKARKIEGMPRTQERLLLWDVVMLQSILFVQIGSGASE